MERINVTEEWRIMNSDSRFAMKFSEKIDMEKAFEAMKDAIQETRTEKGYADLWIQDLGDCCTGDNFDIMSTLYENEFVEYIPAMLIAVAKAFPTIAFSGDAHRSDLKCFSESDFEFDYDTRRLHIKETFMDDDNGYFCPECGYQVALPYEEFDSDEEEIECDDCEETIRVKDLKYVPPVEKETDIVIR